MADWQDAEAVGAPVPAASVAAPTPAAGAQSGLTPDPRDPNVMRGPDGSIAFIGQPSTSTVDGGTPEININGSSNPDFIAGYVAKHPELAQPLNPPAAGPSTAAAPASPDQPTVQAANAPGVAAGDDWMHATPVGADGAPVAPPTASQLQAAKDAPGQNPSIIDPILPAWETMAKDASLGLSDTILPTIAAGVTGAKNLVGMGDGATAGDVYAATKKIEDDREAAFAAAHPKAALGMGIGGAFMTPGLGATGDIILKGLPKLAAATPAALAAVKPALAGVGLLPRIGRAAVVGAGMGALQGGASATNPADLPRLAAQGAALGATGGAVAEPVGQLAGKVLAPAIGVVQRQLSPPNVQQALATAKAALASAGLDFSTMSLPSQQAFIKAVKAGKAPTEVAMQLAGEELPVPLAMSRGQMTGNPVDQLEESLALRGARGPDASNVARTFAGEQQRGLRANADTIATNLGNGAAPGIGGSGEKVSDALNTAYDAKKAVVDKAYSDARAAPGAVLPAYDAQAAAGRIHGAIADYDPLRVPAVARELGRISDMANGHTDPDLVDLFHARTRLTNLRASSDPVEGGAAAKAVKALDAEIDNAVTHDLLRGDKDSVALWKKAIAERRDMGQVFQGNDLIHKLTEREPRSGQTQLKVDAHDASNYIFGRSGLGFVGRRNLYRDLGRLRNVLGANSDGWNAIRSEAFQRIAKTGEGPVENGNQQFSGVKFMKAWRGAKSQDGQLIATLFTPEERATIDHFAGIAARVTSTAKGGDNPSNTAVTAIRTMKRLPFLAGKTIPFIDHIFENLDHYFQLREVQARTVNAKPRMAPVDTKPAGTYIGQSFNTLGRDFVLPRLPSANAPSR